MSHSNQALQVDNGVITIFSPTQSYSCNKLRINHCAFCVSGLRCPDHLWSFICIWCYTVELFLHFCLWKVSDYSCGAPITLQLPFFMWFYSMPISHYFPWANQSALAMAMPTFHGTMACSLGDAASLQWTTAVSNLRWNLQPITEMSIH